MISLNTIYMKTPQCIEITNPTVLLGDFLTIYSPDKNLTNEIYNLEFYKFPKTEQQQVAISIMKVIELIHSSYPDIQIENLGECDFILSYNPQKPYEKLKETFFTIFLCLVAFIGGGYAIMAYNTDIGAKELFNYLSMLFLGNAKQGTLILSITYTIGLTIGLILFFNHLGGKRLSKDPTPLEVQMRLYEADVSTTIIKDMNRRGESIDIKNEPS